MEFRINEGEWVPSLGKKWVGIPLHRCPTTPLDVYNQGRIFGSIVFWPLVKQLVGFWHSMLWLWCKQLYVVLASISMQKVLHKKVKMWKGWQKITSVVVTARVYWQFDRDVHFFWFCSLWVVMFVFINLVTVKLYSQYFFFGFFLFDLHHVTSCVWKLNIDDICFLFALVKSLPC